MQKKQDSWCSPIIHNGKKISGAAAREVLIAQAGSMDELLLKVAQDAANQAYKLALQGVHQNNRAQLKLVA